MQKSLLRRMVNRVLHLLARFLPGETNLRPFLHRLRGVKIHGTVLIGDDVYLENEYPECVELHDGALIGLRSTIIAHFLLDVGKIIIEKNASIMSNCIIVCSPSQALLTIGEGSVISAGSVVQNNIPPYTLCAGPRIEAVASVTVPITRQTSYQDFVRGLRPLKAHGNKTE